MSRRFVVWVCCMSAVHSQQCSSAACTALVCILLGCAAVLVRTGCRAAENREKYVLHADILAIRLPCAVQFSDCAVDEPEPCSDEEDAEDAEETDTEAEEEE